MNSLRRTIRFIAMALVDCQQGCLATQLADENRPSQWIRTMQVVVQKHTAAERSLRVANTLASKSQHIGNTISTLAGYDEQSKTLISLVLQSVVEIDLSRPAFDVLLRSNALGRIVEFHQEIAATARRLDQCEAGVRNKVATIHRDLHLAVAKEIGERDITSSRRDIGMDDEVCQRPDVWL